MRRAVVVGLLISSACGGSAPPVGAPSVRVHSYTQTQTYEEPVVQNANVRDASGELISEGVTLTREREREIERERIELLVGGAPADELEFYRAAGDTEAVRELEEQRRWPRWAARGGLVLLGLGAVGLASSVPLGVAEGKPAGILHLSVGAVLFNYGALLAIWGHWRLDKKRGRVVLPKSRARSAVRRWTE